MATSSELGSDSERSQESVARDTDEEDLLREKPVPADLRDTCRQLGRMWPRTAGFNERIGQDAQMGAILEVCYERIQSALNNRSIEETLMASMAFFLTLSKSDTMRYMLEPHVYTLKVISECLPSDEASPSSRLKVLSELEICRDELQQLVAHQQVLEQRQQSLGVSSSQSSSSAVPPGGETSRTQVQTRELLQDTLDPQDVSAVSGGHPTKFKGGPDIGGPRCEEVERARDVDRSVRRAVVQGTEQETRRVPDHGGSKERTRRVKEIATKHFGVSEKIPMTNRKHLAPEMQEIHKNIWAMYTAERNS